MFVPMRAHDEAIEDVKFNKRSESVEAVDMIGTVLQPGPFATVRSRYGVGKEKHNLREGVGKNCEIF